ncbi:MAG: EamA family transporter RarD [bacterium]|nr:EamA family transporter RarD [bacterium]
MLLRPNSGRWEEECDAGRTGRFRSAPGEGRRGALFGTAAFLWWGVAPLYFKAVGSVPSVEVLAHRIIWSLVFVVGLLVGRGGLRATVVLLREPRTLLTMMVTTCLIALNWLVFIWSIANGRLVEASLGYFINPLVNVALGAIFLRERLRRAQWAAVALAATGVIWLTIRQGSAPWIALVLAVSFAIYGLLRKLARPTGIQGLALETVLLTPLALAWMLWRQARGELAFGHGDLQMTLLLAAAGPVTALPLIWYAEGVRRLRLASMGFLQYLSPSLQFLLAVLAFGEPFTPVHAVGFGAIWGALVVYSWDTVRGLRRS